MASGGTDPDDYLVDVQRIIKEGTWDPESSIDWLLKTPNQMSLRRIKKDVYHMEPPSGCYIEPDEKNFTVIHTLVTGPEDTPYEGGFFYFLVRFPPDYPVRPPRVKIMTGHNKVRFGPNLFKEGLVCISLLGTWPGPSWTPAHCLFTVLESVKEIMNKEPYKNEPGLVEVEGRSERYNDFLCYETIDCAVCEMTENPNPKLPESLRSKIKELFLEKFDFYMKRIEEKKHLDKQPMMVDHVNGGEDGTFKFRSLKKRLKAIRSRFESEESNAENENS